MGEPTLFGRGVKRRGMGRPGFTFFLASATLMVGPTFVSRPAAPPPSQAQLLQVSPTANNHIHAAAVGAAMWLASPMMAAAEEVATLTGPLIGTRQEPSYDNPEEDVLQPDSFEFSVILGLGGLIVGTAIFAAVRFVSSLPFEDAEEPGPNDL